MMIGTFETSNNWIKPKTNNGIAIKFDVNNAKIDFILSKLCLMLKNGICENILNISRNKLAEIIDSNFNYVSQIECGRANITMNMLILLADALDVEAKELFDF